MLLLKVNRPMKEINPGRLMQSNSQARMSTGYLFSCLFLDLSINGSDISVSVSIHYRSWATGNIVSNYMQFAGTINHDQSISMASSSLNGLQDYAFTQTTGAVAQMQHTYSQEKCASS